MTEHILSMLGLALKAGRVEVGEEPVGAAARAKKARVIFVAQDAAPSSVRRAQSFARAGSTLCVTLPADKDALGRSLGRSSVAMCAVTDIGFAESLVKKRRWTAAPTRTPPIRWPSRPDGRGSGKRNGSSMRKTCGRAKSVSMPRSPRHRSLRHRRRLPDPRRSGHHGPAAPAGGRNGPSAGQRHPVNGSPARCR